MPEGGYLYLLLTKSLTLRKEFPFLKRVPVSPISIQPSETVLKPVDTDIINIWMLMNKTAVITKMAQCSCSVHVLVRRVTN